MVHGTWYIVHGTPYMVHGHENITICLHRSKCFDKYLCHAMLVRLSLAKNAIKGAVEYDF